MLWKLSRRSGGLEQEATNQKKQGLVIAKRYTLGHRRQNEGGDHQGKNRKVTLHGKKNNSIKNQNKKKRVYNI